MNILHCTKCHHEWCARPDTEPCSWCGAPGEVIGQTTWPTREQFRAAIEQALKKQETK